MHPITFSNECVCYYTEISPKEGSQYEDTVGKSIDECCPVFRDDPDTLNDDGADKVRDLYLCVCFVKLHTTLIVTPPHKP